jgi:hypothetical protein
LEQVQVTQQIPDGPGVEVLLGAHPEGALRFVVVPGQDVPTAALPEGHGQHQHRDRLARSALRVDHGDLPQPAEVAPDQLHVLVVLLLAPPGRRVDQAEGRLAHRAAQAALGLGLRPLLGSPPRELLRRGRRPRPARGRRDRHRPHGGSGQLVRSGSRWFQFLHRVRRKPGRRE